MITKKAIKQGYKQTKIGLIPEDWRVEELLNVLKQEIREVKKPEKAYYRLGLRSHGKGTFHELVESPENISMDILYEVKENDLIVNITFAWEHAIALANKEDEGKLVSHRFPTYEFKQNFYPLFYKYFVLQPRFKYELVNISPGGAGRNRVMSKSDFLKLMVPAPQIKEQKRIAQILTTWDKAIVKQEEYIKEKEQFKKGLMKKLLSSKVRFKNFNREWENIVLEKLFTFKKGQGLSKEKINDNGEYNCILYGELYTTYSEVIHKVKSKTSIYEGIKSHIDDILIPASTTTSSIDLAIASVVKSSDILIGGDINILRKRKNNVNGEFFARYLTNIENYKIAKYAQGITIIHLYAKDFKHLQVKLPTLEEQTKISKFLSLLDSEIGLLKKELEELIQQKKSLIQKLLTGQVRTKV